jgi:hypothetical protein
MKNTAQISLEMNVGSLGRMTLVLIFVGRRERDNTVCIQL